jgi:hypothetical protein
MCEFVDDKASVFPFEELQRCMVDVMEEWEDLTPFADPHSARAGGLATTRHTPTAPGASYSRRRWSRGKFRMLERHQWKGMDFAAQAEGIRKLTEKYNVEYIGIDATGLGLGVPVGALILPGGTRHPLHA